jgi:hypothetical protein
MGNVQKGQIRIDRGQLVVRPEVGLTALQVGKRDPFGVTEIF